MKHWNTIGEFFEYLNQQITYVVLRNSEELLKQDFVLSGHDIDILCENKNRFMSLCGERRWTSRLSINNNLLIDIAGHKISIDIYAPGDGYYDKCWEEEMLKKRISVGGKFYTLSGPNLFYSLAYHALYHKDIFNEKYRRLLLNIQSVKWDGRETTLRKMVEEFMLFKSYKYTYPLIPSYANFENIPKQYIYKSYRVLVNKELEKIWFVLQKMGRKGEGY